MSLPSVFTFSDGLRTTHPTVRVDTNLDGSTNEWRPSSKLDNWKASITKFINACFGDVVSEISELPEGYGLYDQLKVSADGRTRQDTYLFGHPAGKKFRSPNEFNEHVCWLWRRQNDPESTCACFNCKGKPRGSMSNTPATVRRKRAPVTQKSTLNVARKDMVYEEQTCEAEMAGWVLRKGELVWFWMPFEGHVVNPDRADFLDDDGGNWLAGIVSERPIINTRVMRDNAPGVFGSIDHDETPPWEGKINDQLDKKTYKVNICGTSKTRDGIPQYQIMPWMARTPTVYNDSVRVGKEIAATFTTFDRPAHSDIEVAFNGIFIGGEKIYVGEPVRIISATRSLEHPEDVLVVDRMHTVTEDVLKDGGSIKKRGSKWFKGSVYTNDPHPDGRLVSPQEFAELPFRMRRGDGSGETLKWYIRNNQNEKGEVSMGAILGRWYEPIAVHVWVGTDGRLGCQHAYKWRNSRKQAVADASIPDNRMDIDVGPTTPGFQSINVPGTGGFRSVNMAVGHAPRSGNATDENGEDGSDGAEHETYSISS